MSLKNKSDLFSRTFLQQAGICLLVVFLLLPVSILSLRFGMQQLDKKSCETALSQFLDTYQQQGVLALQKKFRVRSNTKTIFLRLQTKNNQLLLFSDIQGQQSTQLPDFKGVDAQLTGIWVQLDKQLPEYWTIRLSTLPNGDRLQVGIRTTETVRLYNHLTKILLLIWLPLSPVALLPAWIITRTTRKALTRLGEQIKQTAKEGTNTLTDRTQLLPGEKDLALAVSHLTNRHQALVRQLKETMDNVAHDLRTPIARLRTIAEYGLQEEGDPEQLRERLIDCLEESDRLLSMLNTMLNVAEAEAKSMILNLEALDLRETIEEVVELYAIVAEEKNCTLTVRAPEPVMALVDPNRIGQVWANLIDNAIKYEASKIIINLEQLNGQAVATICDNGIGISKTEIDQIWDRLFRGDRSRSQPGLGLGLTLVRAIVQAHSGTITGQSELNTGTTFTVKLPHPPVA